MKWSISRVFITVLIAAVCAACSNIYDSDGASVDAIYDDGVLSVGMEGNDTRTYIGDDRHIYWNADDRVAVFYGNGDNVECRFEGKTGDRSGEIRPVKTYNSKPAILDAIFALYPYSSDVVLQEEDLLTLTLPTIQSYAEDSFGRGANAMVAVSESLDNRSLYFRNMCGTLKLQLWGGVQVKSIRVRGNNNEPLAGNASVVAAYGVAPKLSVYSDSERVVTLDCGGGVQLSESKGAPTTFWVALPPITFDKGFTVEVEDVAGNVTSKSTNKCVVIERNTIQPMAAFEVGATPVMPANNEVWYTTTDGNPVTLRAQCFDSTLKSHEQRDNKWVISFTGTLTTIGADRSSTGAFENCGTLKSITLPDSVTKMYRYTFYECNSLQSVELSDNLQFIGEMSFYNCRALTEITLPASITTIDVSAFYNCSNLSKVTSLATIPPSLGDDLVFPAGVTIYVPESAIGAYVQDKAWRKYNITTISGEGADDTEIYAPNDPNYTSADYSANGTYVALQSATQGEGIDIVLMGDGYSDRQVASGRYEADMRKAMEVFFSKEPYTSFRHLFNVYMVNLVSKREGCSNDYTYGETALNCKVKSDGVSVDADTGDVYSYAKEIFGEQEYEYNDGPRIDESTLIVIMNSNAYAGVCQMTSPKYNTTKSYGNGASLSFFSLCGDDDLFANLLMHEACGHGFAKLADEYYSSGNGAINNRGYYEIKDFEQWGWYKNVDATIGEPLTAQTIKWKHFLNDARYDGLVGIFEGAYTFANGAYRPSEESIMRHVRGSDGEFNAPSREAIYYRIHKLAYGDSWVYNFEDFAAYDAINRN